MSNIIMQPAPGRTQRVVERLPGFIGRELSSARCLPRTADDAEVALQRAAGQEEVVPDSRSKGDKTPQGSKSGFVPDTVLESSTVPARGGARRRLPRGGQRMARGGG